MNKPEGENMVYIFIFIELSCSTHWSFPQLMLCDGILQGCLQRFIMAHFLLPNSHTTPPQLVYKSIFNSSSREMCTPNHLTISLQHKSSFVHTTNNTAGRHGKTSYIYIHHVICRWVLYMLTGSTHLQIPPPHQHIQAPPAVFSASGAQPSLSHWDCQDLSGEQVSCAGSDDEWYKLIHLPELAGFCTAWDRVSVGLVVVEAFHLVQSPV